MYFLICSLLLNAVAIAVGVYLFIKRKRNKPIPFGLASRGIGTVDENGKITFDKVLSYDLVRNPSSRETGDIKHEELIEELEKRYPKSKFRGPGISFKEEDNTGDNNPNKK